MVNGKWRKSSKCDNSGPNCVEVSADETTGTRYVRDSKDPSVVLAISAKDWSLFEDGIREGDRY